MNFQFAYPSAKLKPYIKQYWGFENVLDKGLQYSQRIIPSGLPELIFYFDKRPDAQNRTLEGNALLNVQQNDYYDLIISENLSIFSVTFHPHGISQFFNFPLYELQNQSVFLAYIDKEWSNLVEQKLEESKSFQDRVEVIEAHLLRLLYSNLNQRDFLRMSHIIDLIWRTNGSIDIDTLADNACLSRKQFERKFSEIIGISPKQYLKIIRFQYAIHIKNKSTGKNLTELAYESGYYDQSHFIVDFKQFSGLTPKQLFDQCNSVSDFFE